MALMLGWGVAVDNFNLNLPQQVIQPSRWEDALKVGEQMRGKGDEIVRSPD
jgi:hypothetical protein